MKHFILFAILVIVGASAQPLLFIREDAEPYKGHASAIEDAVDQPTGMQPETAAMPVALTIVVCPGGQYRCPDGTTCCKSATKWACCPYPQAVCCSDKKHCCPHGKTCDPSTSTCKGGDVETDWVAKEPAIPVGVVTEQKTFSVLEEASKNGGESGEQLIQLVSKATSSRVKNVPCGGGRYCPDSTLCCPGGQSCCPLTYSVCCIDGLHCCPAGTTCDIGTGTCRRSYIQLNWMVKESNSQAETAALARQLEGSDIPEKDPATSVGNVPCGGGYSCPDGNTCCKSSGVWKCCPHPQAVCCKDGVHCCPQGKSCGPTSCNSRDFWMELVKQTP